MLHLMLLKFTIASLIIQSPRDYEEEDDTKENGPEGGDV